MSLLLARIYEVLPLLCPQCGGEMKIIAFITEAVAIREMAGVEPDEIDPQAQPAPNYEFDQRVAW